MIPTNPDAEFGPGFSCMSGTEDFPPQGCVHELFSQRARCRPADTAVVDDQGSFTYGELDRHSDLLAVTLRQRGVKEEVLVGLAIPSSVEQLIGLLGILKAGGAYVPLDPAYPQERLEFMLDDAAPALVVTTEAVAGKLPAETIPLVLLDQLTDVASVDFQPASNLASLAYVIYTSGSTGKPKGVLLEHRGLRDMAQFHAQQFDLGPTSRFLQFASICFDASVLEIFCTLVAGGTLHLTAPANRLPGSPLLETLKERKISHVLLPPSTLNVLPDTRLPDLKVLIAGGEPCTSDMVNLWAPGRQFINAYGPTETTVTATTWICDPKDSNEPPIGTPCGETTLYVLDKENRPVSTGQAGELYVGGSGVARGYLNQSALTQERFIANPFGKNAESRLYKTGDKVRLRDDGALIFLGRFDRQIKVRGFRVELGEIEICLQEHPEIKQAFVHVAQPSELHNSMTAYYAAETNAQLDKKAVRNWLEEQLPEYMLPARYVPIDELPRTETGETEVSRLPQSVAPDTSDSRPPASLQAVTLTKIWAEMLGFELIGLDDHFVELGGDSLLSARIAAQAQQQGIEISAQDILSYPTIRELMAQLTKN